MIRAYPNLALALLAQETASYDLSPAWLVL